MQPLGPVDRIMLQQVIRHGLKIKIKMGFNITQINKIREKHISRAAHSRSISCNKMKSRLSSAKEAKNCQK